MALGPSASASASSSASSPVGPVAGQLDAHLLRDRQNLADPLADLGFGHGAEEAVHELAAEDRDHHGDALHLQRRAQLGVGVHVDLGQDPLAVRLGGEFLKHRRKLLARPAPFRPQIHDHGRGARTLHDVGIEGFLGDLDDDSAASGAGAVVLRPSLSRLLPALRGRLPRAQIDGTVKRKIPRLHDSILPYSLYWLIPGSPGGGQSGRPR